MSSTAPLHAVPVRTAKAACERVKARVSAVEHISLSIISECDPIQATDSPKGYYVLAFHSYCRKDICGSTNMGWFAIQVSSGRVFKWNVGDWKLGQPVDGR